jgi:hypothetical protein
MLPWCPTISTSERKRFRQQASRAPSTIRGPVLRDEPPPTCVPVPTVQVIAFCSRAKKPGYLVRLGSIRTIRASFLSALLRYTRGAVLLARRFCLSDEEDCGEGVTGDSRDR